MAAPPGFDYKASMLPDVGGAIHVQGGGGMSGGNDDLKVLTEYGLQPGGIIDYIDIPTKTAFLEQLKSGDCSTNAGNSVIVKKNCWAVVAVIRALIKHDLASEVDDSLDEPSEEPKPTTPKPTPSPPSPPTPPKLTPPTPPTPTPPTPPPPTPPTPALTLSTSPQAPAPQVQTHLEGVKKVDNKLQIDTNKENFYANLNINGIPTRVRGKIPVNLTKKRGGKKKIKTRKLRIKTKLRTKRKYRA
jgi:hypothetical protein